MNISRIINPQPFSADTLVTLKLTGNIAEIRRVCVPTSMVVQKIDKDHGVNLQTGEVVEYTHNTSRFSDKASVAQSLRKLRDIINTNLLDPDNALWVTLTYATNMKDPLQLYEDYRRFWQRFKYYLQTHNLPKAEYIAAAEPQGRGAWHLHVLFLFDEKRPYIHNSILARLWKHGFTKTKSLQGVDNPGLYLCAYLGDMEIGEAISTGNTHGPIAEVMSQDNQGKIIKKAVIKGARLRLYPPGFNLYRCSRGIKRPQIIQTTEAEAMAIVGDAPLTYEKTISISNDTGEVVNMINYRQFNKARNNQYEQNE